MSYAILGLIALFLLSAGYNYIQHSENVKALEKFVGTTKALKAAENENEKMTKALAMFVGDGETEVRVETDGSAIEDRLRSLDDTIEKKLRSFDATTEVALSSFADIERKVHDKAHELGKLSCDAMDILKGLQKVQEQQLDKISQLEAENKKLGLVIAELVDADGEVLHQIRLPGQEARPNVTPCGPLCAHAFWRVDEKYRNKDADLRRRYGKWHCRAGANMAAQNVRDEFLDRSNQCSMFELSEPDFGEVDGVSDREISRGAIADHASMQEDMVNTLNALRGSRLRKIVEAQVRREMGRKA